MNGDKKNKPQLVSDGFTPDDGFVEDFQTAPASATAVSMFPPKKQTRSLGEVLQSTLRPLSYFDPITRATTPPSQMATDVGTALEVGLPFLAQPLPTPLRIPLSGALQGTGTLVKEAMQSAVSPTSTSLGEQFKRAGESALYGTAGQALGEGLGALAQKTAAPFAKQVDAEAIQTAKQYGIKPTPSEVINEVSTGSNIQKLLEDVSSKSLVGAAVIKKQRYENFKALQNYKDEVLNTVAPETAPTKLKEIVTDAVQNNENTFRTIGEQNYKRIDDLIAAKNQSVNFNTPVIMQKDVSAIDTRSLKVFAKQVLDKIPEQERLVAGKAGTEASELVAQMERIRNLPTNISFQDAQFYRSQLLAKVRSDQSAIGGRLKGTASALAGQFDGKMRMTAQKLGTDVYDAYTKANEFWKQGKELFNSDILAGIAKQDPERLAGYVFSPKSGENIGKVQQAIDPNTFNAIKNNVPSDTWQRFKRAGLENIIESKVFQKINQSTGDEFLRGANLYETLKSYGDETLNAWLNPAEKDAMFKFAKMASRINTKEPQIGLWGISQINLGAVGLGTGLVSGDPLLGLTSAGVILGSPALYAKLITSNTGRKWLTEGFKFKAGTREAINFANRFTMYMAKENLQGQQQ